MDANRWEQIEGLFSTVIELPPFERAAFLDRACTGDVELRCEIEAMLTADNPSRALWAEGCLLSSELPTTSPKALVGSRIGPYRLEALVGHGGMGEVYLARRDDGQFRQRVALKLVRSGTGSAEVLLRFCAERQILASLQHPNIARVFDGGLTADGRPYLVMEYVEGEPITDYCDRRRLPVEDRIRLFLKVCGAVQHAHQNLIVHRDLKPGNILVTEEGEPKLLDFGIAKLLAPAEGISVVETGSEVRLMTLAYAAPEQVKGEPVTTVIDVYALSMLLYELLTGHYPYRLTEQVRAAVERVIIEQEPVRPSTAVSRTVTVQHPGGTAHVLTPEAVSRARGTRPERLRRRLAGDLDTIMLTALKKKPERRYASVDAFLEDIRRYQAGLPLLAQKDTRAYRTKKFIRRHQVGVAVAAGLAALLLSFAGIYARGIQQEKQLAQHEAERAHLMVRIMQDLFETADPYTLSTRRGDSLLLALGQQKVENDLAGEPDLQVSLLATLGRIYRKRSKYDQARPLLEQALSMARATYQGPHPRVIEALRDLGGFYSELSAYEKAKDFYSEMLAMQREIYGEHHPSILVSLSLLAQLESLAGNPAEAERLHRNIVAQSRTVHDATEPAHMRSVWRLARVLYVRGKYEEAEQALREVLALRRNRFGEEHPETAHALHWLGLVLTDKGDFAASEQYLRQALAMQHRLLGNEHIGVAASLFGLGLLEKEQGRYEQAVAFLEQSITISRRVLGEGHADVASRMQILGETYRLMGAYDQAKDVLEGAIRICRRTLGEDHAWLGCGLAHLGRVLSDAGDFAAAEAAFTEALSVFEYNGSSRNRGYLATLAAHGELLTRTGRAKEAEPLLREAVSVLTSVTVARHDRYVLHGKTALGVCLSAQRRYAEAEVILQEVFRVYRDHYGSDDPRTRKARTLLLDLPTTSSERERALLGALTHEKSYRTLPR